jgi:hypothetical protein
VNTLPYLLAKIPEHLLVYPDANKILSHISEVLRLDAASLRQHPFDPRGIFTDGSHTPEDASPQQMVCDNIELRQHGKGGSGIV